MGEGVGHALQIAKKGKAQGNEGKLERDSTRNERSFMRGKGM